MTAGMIDLGMFGNGDDFFGSDEDDDEEPDDSLKGVNLKVHPSLVTLSAQLN
jgi:hypothetical protein